MATYGDLQTGFYYILQEQENAVLEMVYVPLVTEKCVLVEHQDEDQTLVWFKKTDAIFELIEQLTDEQALVYESLFAEDEEEEDEDFWSFDDDDDDDDEEWEGPFEDDEEEGESPSKN